MSFEGIPKQVKGGGTERNIKEYKDEVPVTKLNDISNLISNVQRNRPDFEKITRVLDNVNYRIAQRNLAEIEEDIINTTTRLSAEDKRLYLEFVKKLESNPEQLYEYSSAELDLFKEKFWEARDKAINKIFKSKSNGNEKRGKRYKNRYLSENIQNKLWSDIRFNVTKTGWGKIRNLQVYEDSKSSVYLLVDGITPSIQYWEQIDMLTKDLNASIVKARNDEVISDTELKNDNEKFSIVTWLKAITHGGSPEDGSGFEEFISEDKKLLAIRNDGKMDFTFLLDKIQQKNVTGQYVHRKFFGKDLDLNTRNILINHLQGKSINQLRQDKIEFDKHNMAISAKFSVALDAITNGAGKEFTLEWFDENINFKGVTPTERKQRLRNLFIKALKGELTTPENFQIETIIRNGILDKSIRSDSQLIDVTYLKDGISTTITKSMNDLEAANLISSPFANNQRQKLHGENTQKINIYSSEFNQIKTAGAWADGAWGVLARDENQSRIARYPAYSQEVTGMLLKAENNYIAGRLQGYSKLQLQDPETDIRFEVDLLEYGVKKGDSIYIWRDFHVASRDELNAFREFSRGKYSETILKFLPPLMDEDSSYEEYIKSEDYKKWLGDKKKQKQWKEYVKARKLIEAYKDNR